ncbi:MAG: site-2 protease family protein, partial [Planctomycetota bacterium]
MSYVSESTNVIQVILGIGLLIFIHELGHFLVAKKIGVRVHVFSLGFGPAILKKRWRETEYRLSLVPLGGYVKLAGEG